MQNKHKITLLAIDQICGKEQLKIFKKRGTKAAISDFAILLGGSVADNLYANDSKSLENRTGWYWTKTDDGDNDARGVDFYGTGDLSHVSLRAGGVRPALPYSSISSISSNGVRAEDGILEVEYGEYPQQVASKDIQKSLENLFQRGSLRATGKTYTTDSVKYNQYNQTFQKQEHIEYEYNGKKYVRVKANTCFDGQKVTLSNEEKYKDGDYVWVEVQPIRWLVDEEKDIAVAENLLFAGVQFNDQSDYKGNFDKTNLKKFMNNHFSRDIIQSKIEEKQEIEIPNITLQPETRKTIITEENLIYKPGTNITLTLPQAILNQLDTITVQSKEDSQTQKVYKLK